jgi:hypothetical protein
MRVDQELVLMVSVVLVVLVQVFYEGLLLVQVLNRQRNLLLVFCVPFFLHLVAQRFVGDLVERLALVVHLCAVHRAELFLFPFFVLLSREDYPFSEEHPLVSLLLVHLLPQPRFLGGQVVLSALDFEQEFLDGQERVEQLSVCQHPHHLVRQPNREHHAQVNPVYLDEPKTVAHAHSVLLNEHFAYGHQHSLAVHRYRQSDSQCVSLHPIHKSVHNGQ